MAYDTPMTLSFVVTDELGTSANMQFYAMADSTATLGDVLAAWGDMLTSVRLMSSGGINKGHILFPQVPDFVSPASTGSRVEQCGVFNFGNADDTRRWAAVVPSLNPREIANGKIDLTATDVTSWVGFLLSGATAYQFANPATQLLTHLIDAFIAFRKKRRQLARTSYEP